MSAPHIQIHNPGDAPYNAVATGAILGPLG